MKHLMARDVKQLSDITPHEENKQACKILRCLSKRLRGAVISIHDGKARTRIKRQLDKFFFED